MKQNETKKVKGLYNSSITRVRPFFKALIDMDKTGESWLPKLLKATPLNQDLAKTLCEHSSVLLDDCLQEREYHDKILGKTIKLEECFECSIPPSYSFLEWALKNPNELTWPGDGKKTFGPETQYKRECLFGYHGTDTQKVIMKEGLNELKKQGVYCSARQWWSFEGFTEMDCLIETDRYLLGFEGKRTEFISPSTYWFRDRNQIVRNIEVLAELARGKKKEFAFILITEDGVDPMNEENFKVSLPHDQGLANRLCEHYLGCLSWKYVCLVTGINFGELPCDINSIQYAEQSTEKTASKVELENKIRISDYKLLRMHGKVTPQFDHYEAKLRNELYMIGSLRITTGQRKCKKVRLIGYEVPVYQNPEKYVDLLGYDENHNLYVIELKINKSQTPEKVSAQLSRYAEKIKDISGLLAQEIKDTMFLKEFSFSDKIIKLAVVPFDYHGPEGHEIRQWPKDVLVCSIKWNTKLSTLVENRGTDGYVTLDIKANKDQYISQF